MRRHIAGLVADIIILLCRAVTALRSQRGTRKKCFGGCESPPNPTNGMSSLLEPCYLARTPHLRLVAIIEDTLAPQLPRNAELEIFDIGSIAARRPATLLGDHYATNIFRPRGDDARLIAFKQACAWLPDESSIWLRAHDAFAHRSFRR